MNASTSSPTSSSFQPSPSSIHMSPNSPALPVHRSQSSQATSRSPPIPVHALTPEKPGSGSNLQAIHPREDQASLPPRRDADREDEREYLGTGAEAWYGYTPRDMNQAGRGTGARGMMGWIDSPMELTDRSRPW